MVAKIEFDYMKYLMYVKFLFFLIHVKIEFYFLLSKVLAKINFQFLQFYLYYYMISLISILKKNGLNFQIKFEKKIQII
jgi:hypothetical protein